MAAVSDSDEPVSASAVLKLGDEENALGPASRTSSEMSPKRLPTPDPPRPTVGFTKCGATGGTRSRGLVGGLADKPVSFKVATSIHTSGKRAQRRQQSGESLFGTTAGVYWLLPALPQAERRWQRSVQSGSGKRLGSPGSSHLSGPVRLSARHARAARALNAGPPPQAVVPSCHHRQYARRALLCRQEFAGPYTSREDADPARGRPRRRLYARGRRRCPWRLHPTPSKYPMCPAGC